MTIDERLTIRIEGEFHDLLKEHCKKNNISLSKYIRKVLIKSLEEGNYE